MTVPVAMIAGVARNGVIGANGGIPWRIRSDMAFFKRTTMGKPIVMGRKQYETVGRPLPGRTNIVITRQRDYRPEGVIVVGSLEAGIAAAQAEAAAAGADEVMIIGGGEIYAEAMPYADRLYISHIDAAPEGDVLFPPIDPAVWRVAEEPRVDPDPRDSTGFHVKVYERR